MTMETRKVLDIIERMFPDARCELEYSTTFQLAVSVILSAQTTDISVNKVTPALFHCFPDASAMASASIEEIEALIRQIGLYHTKAKHILQFAQELQQKYGGEVPSKTDELIALSGIGSKTANVIQAVGFGIPALAVDTHVDRVSHRLGLVPKNANIAETEKILKRTIPKERWIKAHHAILFFGRYHCKSQKPQCRVCPFEKDCPYNLEKSRNQP